MCKLRPAFLATLFILGLLLGPPLAWSAPPYDITVDLTAGTEATSHVLLVDGVEAGVLVPGQNEFPDLLTADGTYTFQAKAINEFGETLSDPVTFNAAQPGKPIISVTVSFSVQ